MHEPESGNYIVQANFSSAGNALRNGIIQLTTTTSDAGQPMVAVEVESEPESNSKNNKKCQNCGVRFRSRKALKLHSDVHVEEALYACEFCSATRIPWTEMWLHQCSNADSIPLICPHCHKTVSNKKQLQAHEEVHELQRRFKSKRMEGYFKRKLQHAEDPVVDWGTNCILSDFLLRDLNVVRWIIC